MAAELQVKLHQAQENARSARDELTRAQATPPPVAPPSPSRNQSVELEKLRQQVVELQAEKEDLSAALKTTQEDAIAQVEAFQKISDHEARMREDDHANSIALLKREMSSGSVPSTPVKGVSTPGGSPLDKARSAEVEMAKDARIRELEAVSARARIVAQEDQIS